MEQALLTKVCFDTTAGHSHKLNGRKIWLNIRASVTMKCLHCEGVSVSEQEQRTVVKSSSLEIHKTQSGRGSEHSAAVDGVCRGSFFPGAFPPKLVMVLVGSWVSKCCWPVYQSRELHRLLSDKMPVLLLNYMSLCQFPFITFGICQIPSGYPGNKVQRLVSILFLWN